MAGRALWIRWSWRDLRRRWIQVATISLVIALGTGTYAGLLSTSAWRKQSNDASFALLHVHDLRVSLAEGTTVAEGSLAGLVRSIPDAAALTGVRERLVVPTQVAGAGGLLVPGELVGSAIGAGTAVDTVSNSGGRPLTKADDGAAVVVLEQQFAAKNHLPVAGQLVLSGNKAVRFVGRGQSPEYFVVSGKQGALPFLSEKAFGVLFTSLHAAQRLADLTGRVNDVVVTVRPGMADAVHRELSQAVSAATPHFDADITTREDIHAYRLLYDDIYADEALWRIIAVLVLSGAAFAAFNLTSRVVEAQRREIGIGMALGVRLRALAVRPLLFGAQVALIGVVLGIAVGWLLGIPLRGVFLELLPLPIWHTGLQLGTFSQAAALGFVLPFAAAAWPVWRALRVQPADAIRVGQLVARRTGLGLLGAFGRPFRGISLPGRSYRQMPVRNVVRTPRRSVLTTLGVAAAITTLVTTMGFLDSFNAAIDKSARAALHSAPQRVTVSLSSLQPVNGNTVRRIRELPGVAVVRPGLLVPVTARHAGRSVDLVIQTIGADAVWRPELIAGQASGGIVLARKAAADLRVHVGGTVTIEHPQQTASGLRTVTTAVRVAGLHPDAIRVFAYLDDAGARIFGFTGLTNVLTVLPAAATSPDAVRHALLEVHDVSSAQAAQATTDGMRAHLQEYLGIMRVAAAVTLLLALLIAFNTSSIGMDERARENATMLAFGLPARTVLSMAITEAAIIGVLATLVGLGGGYLLVSWIASTTIAGVLPEIGVAGTLANATLAWSFGLGVLTVALAPLLTARRLLRLDVPSTLRVVE